MAPWLSSLFKSAAAEARDQAISEGGLAAGSRRASRHYYSEQPKSGGGGVVVGAAYKVPVPLLETRVTRLVNYVNDIFSIRKKYQAK